jgi:predicted nucleotidyltransferase
VLRKLGDAPIRLHSDPPMLSDDELVEALQRLLFQERPQDLVAAYVFGSTASGRQHPDSDLDLAFLGRGSRSVGEVLLAAQELGVLAGRDVDLVDLARATTVFRAQVVGTGRRIHGNRDPRVGEFEMYALSDYARLNEERRGAVKSFLERYRD